MDFRQVPLEILDRVERAINATHNKGSNLHNEIKKIMNDRSLIITEAVDNCVTELAVMPSHITVIDIDGDEFTAPKDHVVCGRIGHGYFLNFVGATSSGAVQISESEYNRLKKILVGE